MTDAAERQREAEVARALQAGVERYGDGDLDGAAAALEEALRLEPEHPHARRYLGWVRRCLRLRGTPAAPTPAAPRRAAASGPAPLAARATDSGRAPLAPARATDSGRAPLTPLPSLTPTPPRAPTPRAPVPASPSPDSPLSGFTGVLVTSVAEALREAEAQGAGASSAPSPAAEIDPDLGYRIEIEATPEVSLDPAAEADGDLNLTDLVAEAAQWSALSDERPEIDEAGLISISDELIEGELPAGRATETPFAPLAFRGSPRSVVHVDLETGLPASGPRPPAPQAPPGSQDSQGRQGRQGRSWSSSADLPPPLLEGLELSDAPRAPPEVLLADDDIELVAESPRPASTSPLVAEELFAGLADPEPSEPSRPLVARPKTALTPDFVVDFEDVISSAPAPAPPGAGGGPPMAAGPPPAPQRQKAPPQLEEAGRALGRGDAETAYRRVEQLIEEAGGDPGAPSLRPYQGLIAAVYEGMLRPLDRVPRTGRLPKDLEPASAFLLSLLDGSMTIEDALTVSGMDRLRGARTLVGLMRRGLLTF